MKISSLYSRNTLQVLDEGVQQKIISIGMSSYLVMKLDDGIYLNY